MTTTSANGGRLRAKLIEKINGKTKPLGSLGRIESLAVQIGCVLDSINPVVNTCRLTLFAGDHGFVSHGLSAFPQEVTRQMVLNFLGRGAASTVIAKRFGVDIVVVDAGVAGEPLEHPDLRQHRVAAGTDDAVNRPAMTDSQFAQALDTGRAIGAEGQHQVGCFGEMGIGNTASASLVAAKILGADVADLVGRGTGLDDAGLEHKRQVLIKAAKRTAPILDPCEALTQYGGFEVVMLAGATLGAAQAGKLVIVDGFISTAASLAAVHMEPAVRDSLVFAHQSAEAGHRRLLEALEAAPLLDLDMRLGEGTGALMAWPLVQAAATVLTDMASFESASVSNKD